MKDVSSSDCISFTNFGMSKAKNFAGDRPKVRLEIRLNPVLKDRSVLGNLAEVACLLQGWLLVI